ncbi:MAG: hypothetical protein ACRBFS_19425 [Aureispira sp.]
MEIVVENGLEGALITSEEAGDITVIKFKYGEEGGMIKNTAAAYVQNKGINCHIKLGVEYSESQGVDVGTIELMTNGGLNPNKVIKAIFRLLRDALADNDAR